ncbi:MAG TPA: oligopeptide/dipeptide ABC transporter ATP-binding protein [Thermoplasmata archaeon]|nr:oligopeptide/dipeptide ABC transporter ATP-binding protein [Thermoplasmata archaeon]
MLLAALGLKKHFPVKGGLLQREIATVRAVDGVDLVIRRGETVALVGESGCGKTTLGRLLLRLIEPTEGDVLFNVPVEVFERLRTNGRDVVPDDGHTKDLLRQYSLTRLRRRSMKALRRFMQPVFQDPFTSLDPRLLVKDIVAEPLLVSGLATRLEAYEQSARLLQEVGLRPEHLYRFPHEFSGGQRQRIAIARALAPEPEFLLLDEPTSALDVSVQAQILNLLKEIQQRQNLTYLLITHNLSVVRHMADRVAVMYLGRILERTRTAELFANPMHPYTKALLSAVPVPDPKRRRERIILPGDVPSPIAPPAGCRFHTRCNAVLPHCGWSSRDVAATAAYLFDPSRNPEASDLPPLEEVTIRGDEVLLLRYREPATESHRLRVEALVRARSSRPDGIAFRAIARVGLDTGRVVLEFLPPLEPELLEIAPHHFVACYLYPGTQPVAT